MDGMVVVREVGADEWAMLRDVRLAALREAPYAFSSTYAREAQYAEDRWRSWLGSRGVMLFGCLPDAAAPAGLAGVYKEDGAADLVSMWVHPGARRRGLGEALITAAADWAKARDHDTLYLWVTETNAPAKRLYERCGFTPTGERQPLPSDPSLAEIRMLRPL